jgi:hypothetical protein
MLLFSSKIILPKRICLIKKNIAEKGIKKREISEKVEKKLKKGYHQLLEKKEVITLGQKNCI